MDNYEKVVNRLSIKYGLPIDIIKKITGSQFSFARETIKNLDIDAIEEEDDLDNTSFRFMGLADLHINLKQLKKIRTLNFDKFKRKNYGNTNNTN